MLGTVARVLGFTAYNPISLPVKFPDEVPSEVQEVLMSSFMGLLNAPQPADDTKFLADLREAMSYIADPEEIVALATQINAVIIKFGELKLYAPAVSMNAAPVDKEEAEPIESLLDAIKVLRPRSEGFFTLLEDLICAENQIAADCLIDSIKDNVREYCLDLMSACPTPEVMVEQGCSLPWYPPEYEGMVEEIMHAKAIEFDAMGIAHVVDSGHPGAVDGRISLPRLIVENMLLIHDPDSKFLIEVGDWDPILDPSVFIQSANGIPHDLSPDNWAVADRCACCGKGCRDAA